MADLQISLTNDLGELAALATRIEEFCAARDVAPSVAFALNLSLDELLTNTINYGYEDGDSHRIDVAVRMEGSAIVVEISDDAKPFDPADAPRPDTGAALEDRPIGGLGVHFVRQMMDGFHYSRSGGRNIVTLTKEAGAAP